jgi:hypothetical protein
MSAQAAQFWMTVTNAPTSLVASHTRPCADLMDAEAAAFEAEHDRAKADLDTSDRPSG